MDSETGFKGAYHIFIARNSRKQAKFYLRIVGVYEQIIVAFRREKLAQFSAQFRFYRYILEVRLRAGDPARRRDRLVKAAVDPAILFDICSQTVRVGGI